MTKNNHTTIIVDYNEPNSMYSMIMTEGLPVKKEHLTVGDYQIGYVVIERKTVPDLIASVKDGRLWKQLYKMHQSSKEDNISGVLAVIGEIPTWDYCENKSISQEKYKYYLSLIDSISIRCITSFKINFRWFKTPEQFVSFISKVYAVVKVAGSSTKPITVKKEFRTLEQIKSDIFSMIPSIGRETADYLAHNYTIEQIISKSVEELSSVKIKKKKLGYTRAKTILDCLTK